MLKFVLFETLATVMRMVFILPVLAIWLAICTLYLSGYDHWASMMHDILSNQASFQMLYEYLFAVSFLISVFYFVPSRLSYLLNPRSGQMVKVYATPSNDSDFAVTGSDK